MTPVIYRFSFPNGKVYIGKSINYKKRLTQHLHQSKENKRYLYTAIRKYGWNNIVKDIIWELPESNSYDIDELNKLMNDLETYYINLYNANEIEFGYNLTEGGDGITGHKFTEEHKINLSIALTGKKHSEETKRKISESNKGRIVTEETRAKISEAKTGITLSKQSEEHIQKRVKCLQKKVVQKDESGNIIKVYNSQNDAAKELNVSKKVVHNVLYNITKNRFNIYWLNDN